MVGSVQKGKLYDSRRPLRSLAPPTKTLLNMSVYLAWLPVRRTRQFAMFLPVVAEEAVFCGVSSV